MNDIIRTYNSDHSRHSHDDFHQIIIPLTGKLDLNIEGRNGHVIGRTLGIVTQGEAHAFAAQNNNQFLVLDIDENQAEHNFERIWARAIDSPFLSMSEALLSLSDYAVYCAQHNTSQKWVSTWQNLFLQTIDGELENDLPALPQRLQKAIEFMQSNLGKSISNADLASNACLSPARFHELFRQTTGISPQQYLTQCRLKAATKLILQSHSLSSVASDTGFADQSTFGRAFKKEYGISPGQWRQSALETK